MRIGLPLLNNFVPSCQELWAEEVKLSARQEKNKGGEVFRPVSRMIISLSAGLEEVLPALRAHLLAASPAARCWERCV